MKALNNILLEQINVKRFFVYKNWQRRQFWTPFKVFFPKILQIKVQIHQCICSPTKYISDELFGQQCLMFGILPRIVSATSIVAQTK